MTICILAVLFATVAADPFTISLSEDGSEVTLENAPGTIVPPAKFTTPTGCTVARPVKHGDGTYSLQLDAGTCSSGETSEVRVEYSETTVTAPPTPAPTPVVSTSCNGATGKRLIKPDSGSPIEVECKNGWMVIQKRISSSDFYQNWNAYTNGFGDDNNFWLGNDKIHRLCKVTSGARVELTAGSESRYAEYSSFSVGNAATKYQLSVSGYSGNAGDSLGGHHSSRKFSTYDQDNDNWGSNCASRFKGAWWYGACHHSNLNGIYHGGDHGSYADGMNWYHWKGYHHSMTKSYIMIK